MPILTAVHCLAQGLPWGAGLPSVNAAVADEER